MTWRRFIVLLGGLSAESRLQLSMQTSGDGTHVVSADAWVQQFRRGAP